MIVSIALVSLCVKWSDTALVTQKQPNLAHFCVKTNLDTDVDSTYFNLPFFLDTARFPSSEMDYSEYILVCKKLSTISPFINWSTHNHKKNLK